MLERERYKIKSQGTKKYFKDLPESKARNIKHQFRQALTPEEIEACETLDARIRSMNKAFYLVDSFDFFEFHDDLERESNLIQTIKFKIPYEEIHYSLTVELDNLVETLKRQFESTLTNSAFDPQTVLEHEIDKLSKSKLSIFDEMIKGAFITNLDQEDIRHKVVLELAGIKFFHFLNELKSNNSRLEGHIDRKYFLLKERKKLKWTGSKKALGTLFAVLHKEELIIGKQVDIQRMIIENFEDFSISYLQKNFIDKNTKQDTKYENDQEVKEKMEIYTNRLLKLEIAIEKVEESLADLTNSIKKKEI